MVIVFVIVFILKSIYLFDAFDGSKFFDEGFELGGVVNEYGDIAAEEAVVGSDIDGTENEFVLLIYDT